MPFHALELLPDRAGQQAIRRDWQMLHEAGLRSQLDHRGATNAPHLTLLAAVAIGPQVEALAVELIAPLLPIRVRASGLLLLGARRLTLARAAELEDQVMAAVQRLRAAAGGPHPGWQPHLTLARGLPRSDVQNAIEALGHGDLELSMTELRHWDPDNRSVTSLATSQAAGWMSRQLGASPDPTHHPRCAL